MLDPLDAQRKRHAERVAKQLGVPVSEYIRSPRSTSYRARIELTRGQDGALGFRSPKTHHNVRIERCEVARNEINVVLEQLPMADRVIDRLALRSNGKDVVIHARCKDKHRSKARRWLDELSHLEIPLALNGRGVLGDPTTRLTVAGIQHRLSPATFYQVNLEVNEVLVQDVSRIVTQAEPNAVLDLFSGAGNLSMPLAAEGLKCTLIESHPTATKDARRTASDHGLNIDIRTARAETFQAGDAFFDVAILDPPRKGAGVVIEQVLLTRPKAVVMVSCNTRTLIDDLKRASKLGYSMESVRLYEMFPHTNHVEAMGVLSSR